MIGVLWPGIAQADDQQHGCPFGEALLRGLFPLSSGLGLAGFRGFGPDRRRCGDGRDGEVAVGDRRPDPVRRLYGDDVDAVARSEDRRVGKGSFSSWCYWW